MPVRPVRGGVARLGAIEVQVATRAGNVPAMTTPSAAVLEEPDDRRAGDGLPERLVVVRHGATQWSRSGRHTGRTDLGLDEGGVAQAVALGERLAALGIAVVYSSPLRRAMETCRLAGFGTDARYDDDLVEWDYGDYEGRTTPEVRATRPGWQLFDDGCPGGEQLVDVARRADAFLDRLRAAALPTGSIVAVFSHGHLLRVLAARWLGLEAGAGRHFVLDAGRVGVLGFDRETSAVLGWNA